MPKANADSEKEKEIQRKLYEKPCLKAVDLYADEIMGGCLTAPPCTIFPDPPGSGPTSGAG